MGEVSALPVTSQIGVCAQALCQAQQVEYVKDLLSHAWGVLSLARETVVGLNIIVRS